MTDPLPTGATIGILGGGQLGRMLALAAARLGLKVHIYEPEPGCPASQVADRTTTAMYEDSAALLAFARACDVVTYEFENVPAAALDIIEAQVPIRPGRRALAISQDRLDEKTFLNDIGLSTAAFAAIDTASDAVRALGVTGQPAILKTRRFGYDGKGQARVASPEDIASEFGDGAPGGHILEGVVPFEREISVIAARGADGETVAFDPGENVHEGGILRTTTVPARLSRSQAQEAVLIAGRVLNALDYVGVLGIELFVAPSGLLVNEFAPRVHNSGHWTQNGCVIDQFEQHVRAIAGWPLGDGARHSDVAMENLLGSDIEKLPELARSGAALHLYGKAEARPGRKMGHINRITGPAR